MCLAKGAIWTTTTSETGDRGTERPTASCSVSLYPIAFVCLPGL